MHRSNRFVSRITRTGAAIALTALTVGAMATPAQAHETPKASSTCAMSGMTVIDHGDVYVCVSKTAGAKPRWGKALPVSKSALTWTDGWVKVAKSGMSGAFGMLKNPTAKPITVIGASSSASKVLQLHEVVDKDGQMVMQQKPGGFTIPAGGMVELKAGGSHVMFMKITKPITAGAMVPVTLITSDGGLMTAKLMGKVYSGANETYMPGM